MIHKKQIDNMSKVHWTSKDEHSGAKKSMIQLNKKTAKSISNAEQQEKVDHLTLLFQVQNLHP